MKMTLRRLVFLVAFLAFAIAGIAGRAQSARFEFIAPHGGIVVGPGDSGDVVVVTGRSLGFRTAGTCGATPDDAYPLQMGVALDPGDQGRGPRMTEIQPLLAEPLKPGTRLKNLALVSDCQIGGSPYQKFTGEME
jgi:hypothetical protein